MLYTIFMNKIKIIKLFEISKQWPDVVSVCSKLIDSGFDAYIVGGAVRDALLSIEPKDFDIGTSAKPDDLFKIFPESIEVGKRFGIAIIPFKGFQVEIASFRTEGQYIDGRRPNRVNWCGAELDSKRRDFTINAIFFNMKTHKITDFHDGLTDLKEQSLRSVGNAEDRFNADYLRILRALRFSGTFNFSIEDKTKKSIINNLNNVFSVSKERQKEEFEKCMLSKRSHRCLFLYFKYNLISYYFQSLKNIENIRFSFNENIKSKILFFNSSCQIRRKSQTFSGNSNKITSEFYLYFLFINKQKLLGQDYSESLKHLWFLFSYFYLKIHIFKKIASGEFDKSNLLYFINKTLYKELFNLKISSSDIKYIQVLLKKYLALFFTEKPRLANIIKALSGDEGLFLHKFLKNEEILLIKNFRDSYLARKRIINKYLDDKHRLPISFVNGRDILALGLKGAALGDLLNEVYMLQIEGILISRKDSLSWLKDRANSLK